MNKIKEFFADWSLGNSERKPVYVSYDTDKQSEPGAWSKR